MNSWMAAERKMSVNPRNAPTTFCPEPSPPPTVCYWSKCGGWTSEDTFGKSKRNANSCKYFFWRFTHHCSVNMVQKPCHNKLPSEMDVASIPLTSLESWHTLPLVRCPGTSMWHSARVHRWRAASMPRTKERRAGSHCSPPWPHHPHLQGKTEWLEVRRGNRFLVFFFFFFFSLVVMLLS